MTTDTRPKIASRQLNIDGKTVTLTGIAKGAGMIQPNMATMLCYMATDARCDRNALQDMLASRPVPPALTSRQDLPVMHSSRLWQSLRWNSPRGSSVMAKAQRSLSPWW